MCYDLVVYFGNKTENKGEGRQRLHFSRPPSLGVTTAPNGQFMKQVARNLTDVDDGFLLDSRYLIMDRDTKYTADFRGLLDRAGVKPVRCPPRAPCAMHSPNVLCFL